MSRRRRAKSTGRRKKRVSRRAFLAGLGIAACGAGGYILWNRFRLPAGMETAPSGEVLSAPNPALPSGEWRAVWVSYLEFAGMDFSSAEAFRADAAALLDNCAALGLNTVLVQVRPFGDALYPSALYPWSHLCTGAQGQDPGFDPLDILLTEAHGRGLSLEAWVNPYRLRSSAACPPSLARPGLVMPARAMLVSVMMVAPACIAAIPAATAPGVKCRVCA